MLLLLLVCLDVSACGHDAPPEARRQNVILAMVDTLRADHLGVYGYARETSPHIDAFARSHVLFTEARSQAPCTFPSINSLLTSRHPVHFLGQERGRLGIPERFRTLPEILRARGYSTLAVSSSPIVRTSPAPHNLEGGFGRGFDVFNEDCFRKEAACVNSEAFALLDTVEAPFFLYLHYLEPHGPYSPPDSHPRRFASAYAGKDFVARGEPKPIAEMLYKDGPAVEFDDADLQHLVDLYDEEILYFDGQFQVLLDELRRRGLWEDTILVLLSDHGEDFLEHGDIKHCRNLYDTQIKTPLVLRAPDLDSSRRITGSVGNLDVVPTLLDWLGIDAAELEPEGRSLRQTILRGASGNAATSAAWRSLRSLVDGRYKLVVDLRSGHSELYDLEQDPAEETDLRASRPAELARLTRLLDTQLGRLEPDRHRSVELADESARQLRALGYLE